MRVILNFHISCLLVLICFSSTAQCTQWNWPEDKAKAEEQLALLQDAMRFKKYHQGIEPLNWLLTNSPTLHNNVYLHGANVYDALASKEKNLATKDRYVDSLLILYDLRMKNCGEISEVLNRKSLAAFKFYINGDKAPKILPLMDSAFSYNKENVFDAMLLPYMQTIVVLRTKFKQLSDEDILSRYDLVTKITDEKIKILGTSSESLKKTRKELDEWLFKVIKPDCDFVRTNLAPKFKQNKTDLILAKRIFSFMLQGKCTEDPLWLEAGEQIFSIEKDFGLGKNIAIRYLTLENLPTSEKYFNETLSIASNRPDSSEIYYYKGLIESKKPNKPKAREYFFKSVELDPSRKEAYERIGDLYFGSFEECAKKENQAEDRGVYLAAYYYYLKAGNKKKMASTKQLFPSNEDIFLVNLKIGDKLKVGCWIGEEVVVQTRDQR